MEMNLFLDKPLEFEKTSAAETTLPEDPNSWPMEILQELYKQVPYAADFEPEVEMAKVDAERAYGFGRIHLKNKTEIPNDGMGSQQAAGVNAVSVPFIVKNGKLQPLDLVATEDHLFPLTEGRLRKALFRPQAFDMSSKMPGDQSIVGMLYPPYRQNNAFGGGGGATMPMGDMGKMGQAKEAWLPPGHKDFGTLPLNERLNQLALAKDKAKPPMPSASSVKPKADPHGPNFGTLSGDERRKQLGLPKIASLLAAILPSINVTDYADFCQRLQEPNLKQAFVQNPATVPALHKLAEYEPTSGDETALAIRDFLPPTAIQFRKLAAGYEMTTGNHTAWSPESHEIDRGQLVKLVGVKLAMDVDLQGGATVAPGATIASEGPEEDKPELISTFGQWKVEDSLGRHLIGWVFPQLMDLDGTTVPLALFTNGSQASLQGEVVGTPVAEGANLPEGMPSGHGVFYEVLSNGKAQATIPLEILTSVHGQDDSYFLVGTLDGHQTQLKVQPNLKMPTMVEGVSLIPAHYKWLPLDKTDSVVLVDKTESYNKMAHARAMVGEIEIRGRDKIFSLSGLPLDKLAADDRNFLSPPSAVFLMAGLGIEPAFAKIKLAQAERAHGPVKVSCGRVLSTVGERLTQAKEAAAKTLSKLPNLRQDLLKEAAAIPDPMAVDTVLSLGFVNPENIETFTAFLPVIEESQQRLCDLLFASRLGLNEVPTSALEKSIKSVESVIEGLKILAFQKS